MLSSQRCPVCTAADDELNTTLETPAEIGISDDIRKMEQEWLDQFLQGIDEPTQQELNDKAIAQVLSEETDNPQIDGKIEDIFIDDDEKFEKDNITEEDKEFIRNLLDKSNYYLSDGDNSNNNNNGIDFEVAKRILLPDSGTQILLFNHLYIRVKG